MQSTGFRPRKGSYHPKPYPSDLRESEWHAVRSLFPHPNKGEKNRRNPVRILLNASLWRLEYQKSLNDLTIERPDMPPWGTVHSFEYRLKLRNMWPEILKRIHRTRLLAVLPKIMRVTPAGMMGAPPMRRDAVDTEGLPVGIREQISDPSRATSARLSLASRLRLPCAVRMSISDDDAQAIGDAIGVDWESVPLDQFLAGLQVELEHGARDAQTDVTHDDLIQTGKIALAHLKERPDYYSMLKKVEGARFSLNSRLRPSVRNAVRMALPGEILKPAIGHVDSRPGMRFVYSGRGEEPRLTETTDEDQTGVSHAFIKAVRGEKPHTVIRVLPSGYSPSRIYTIFVADPKGRTTRHDFHGSYAAGDPAQEAELARILGASSTSLGQFEGRLDAPEAERIALATHARHVASGSDPNSYLHSHVLLHKDMGPAFRRLVRARTEDARRSAFYDLQEAVQKHGSPEAVKAVKELERDGFDGQWGFLPLLKVSQNAFENVGGLLQYGKTELSKRMHDTADKNASADDISISRGNRLRRRIAERQDMQFEDDRHLIDESGNPAAKEKSLRERLAESGFTPPKGKPDWMVALDMQDDMQGENSSEEDEGNRLSLSRFSCEGHDYSSTQLNLPPDLAAQVLAFGQQIPDEELLNGGSGEGKGREPVVHCTLRYGLHTQDASQVAATLRGHHPAMFTLGPVAAFQGDDKDVLFVEAHGPSLHTLNASLGTLEHTDTHADYNPHVTVAYLKPGMAKKYVGNMSFCGKEALCDYVVFSPSDGNDAFITLDGRADVRMSLVRRMAVQTMHNPAGVLDPDGTHNMPAESTPPPAQRPANVSDPILRMEDRPSISSTGHSSDFDSPVPTIEQLYHPSTRVKEFKGSISNVNLRTTADGKKWFVKEPPHLDKDRISHAQAEQAATEVLRALGHRHVPPAKVLYYQNTPFVVTPAVKGRDMSSINLAHSPMADTPPHIREAVRGSRQKIADYLLATWLISASDRHHGNHIVSEDFKTIHPIDFGFSFHRSDNVNPAKWSYNQDAHLEEDLVAPTDRPSREAVNDILSRKDEILAIAEKSLNDTPHRNSAQVSAWNKAAVDRLKRKLEILESMRDRDFTLADLPEEEGFGRLPYHKPGDNSFMWPHGATKKGG